MYQYSGSVQTDAAFSSEIQEVDMEDVGQDYDGKSLRSLINRSKKDVVEVPLKKTDQVVEIDLSQVHNAGEIFDILNQENSEMLYYLLFAIEFTKRDQDEDAIAMAEQGLNAPGNDQSKIALLNLLASLYIRKGRTLPSTAKDERATCYAQATERYNQTSQIDSRNPITWIGKSTLDLIFIQKQNTAIISDENTLKCLVDECNMPPDASVDNGFCEREIIPDKRQVPGLVDRDQKVARCGRNRKG